MEPDKQKKLVNYIGIGCIMLVGALMAVAFVKSCGKGPILGPSDAGAPVPLPFDPLNPSVGVKGSAVASASVAPSASAPAASAKK